MGSCLSSRYVCSLRVFDSDKSVSQGYGDQGETIWSGQSSSGQEEAASLLQSLLRCLGHAEGWLVARLTTGSLTLATEAGKLAAGGAGSGPDPFSQHWREGVVDFPAGRTASEARIIFTGWSPGHPQGHEALPACVFGLGTFLPVSVYALQKVTSLQKCVRSGPGAGVKN